MTKHGNRTETDLAAVGRILEQIDESRKTDLVSLPEQKFDSYRIAHKKAEVLAYYVSQHPEILEQVRAEMDELRRRMQQGEA